MGDDEKAIAREVWCSGDAPDNPVQVNFEGLWTLAEANGASVNGRPHYSHVTPARDNPVVHLFFTKVVGTGTARWVIGPTPEDGASGWAFADSDADTPEDVIEVWNAWHNDSQKWAEVHLGFKERSAASSLTARWAEQDAAAVEEDEEDEDEDYIPESPEQDVPEETGKAGAFAEELWKKAEAKPTAGSQEKPASPVKQKGEGKAKPKKKAEKKKKAATKSAAGKSPAKSASKGSHMSSGVGQVKVNVVKTR